MIADEKLGVAIAIHAAWREAFVQRNAVGVAALYARHTAFYGSVATLLTDRASVCQYFATLPVSFVGVNFGQPEILPLGPTIFAACGDVVFVQEQHGQNVDLRYRISFVIVREDEEWRIAVHHASPQPNSLSISE